MSLNSYPETVTEVLDENMCFRPAVLQAARRFAASKPWRGTLEERKAKFRKLNRGLAAVHRIATPRLVFRRIDGSSSARSFFDAAGHRIVLAGKLSVVTVLHEFAHALRMGEREATAWSANLFGAASHGNTAA